jgi:hypothetical protein
VTAAYTDLLTVGGGTGTLTNNAGASITIFPGTGGTRTINGNLDNSGTVTVHPSILQVNGTFNHQGVGILNLEIGGPTAGTGYSRVSASGATFLFQGTLNYSLVNGFTPTTGSTFNILSAPSIGGTFLVRSQPGGWAPPTNSGTIVSLTAP